ncbi:MAG: LuxR C-terminal-related transcriptional regulator [Spirochaetota bacterium]|nr:LuxR C-terminal-related transcriptional regulator [Spirochaetota bacterium]
MAERLNIAESTVKLHLYNIYNKIGVDNRFAIIDLCKYNFPS